MDLCQQWHHAPRFDFVDRIVAVKLLIELNRPFHQVTNPNLFPVLVLEAGELHPYNVAVGKGRMWRTRRLRRLKHDRPITIQAKGILCHATVAAIPGPELWIVHQMDLILSANARLSAARPRSTCATCSASETFFASCVASPRFSAII